MDVSKRIADFVVGAAFEAMPPVGLETAKTAILDCLGVSLAGSRAEDAEICNRIVRQEQAAGVSSVYGHDFRTSAQLAAFANGVAAHAEDYDHSFVRMGQPTAPVIPAAFAMGEALRSSGRQVIEAYVVGFEVTARLAFALQGTAGGGWHGNGTAGIFGAASACAKLLGLNADQIVNAIGITASLASGLSVNFGTMTKPLHVGQAARNGLLAAQLASAGYTASALAMEGRNGYFAAFYRGSTPDLDAFDELGKSYALETIGIRVKPYPCGGLTHSAIHAAIQLRDEHRIQPDAVESVRVDVMEGTYNTIAFRRPQNAIQAKFCMPYLIARALTDGAVTLDSFTEGAARDPAVLNLAERIEMFPDTALRPGEGSAVSARVTIKLRTGETLTQYCEDPKGTPKVPMTASDMEAKFRECAKLAISDETADEALDMLGRLEGLEDVTQLCRLLGSPG